MSSQARGLLTDLGENFWPSVRAGNHVSLGLIPLVLGFVVVVVFSQFLTLISHGHSFLLILAPSPDRQFFWAWSWPVASWPLQQAL